MKDQDPLGWGLVTTEDHELSAFYLIGSIIVCCAIVLAVVAVPSCRAVSGARVETAVQHE